MHKARHRGDGKLVALKKILMHNAKEEGVSRSRRLVVYSGADNETPVSDYRAQRDKDPEDAVAYKRYPLD